MALVLPDQRLEQPAGFYPHRKPLGRVQVDRAHPMSRGLLMCNLLSDTRELVTDKVYQIGTTSDITVSGKGAHYLGSSTYQDHNSYLAIPAVDFTNVSDLTIVCAFKNLDTNGYPALSASVTSGGFSGNYMLSKEQGALRLRAGGTTSSLVTTTNLTDGAEIFSAGIQKGNTPSILYNSNGTWANKVNGANVNPVYAGVTAENNIGYYSRGGGRSYQDAIYFVYLWERALSDEEIRSLYLNPYQIVRAA